MIILNYPKFVGGKFVSNCIALSRHCVVQDKKIAQLDIKFSGAEYYNFKLRSVLKSLPNKDAMNNWFAYEFGCKELYGIHETFYQDNSIAVINQEVNNLPILKQIQNANKQSCIIAHDYRTALKYLLVYKDAKFVEFNNFDHFRLTAAKLKQKDFKEDEEYTLSAKYYHQDQEFFKLDSYTIDVDSTFFDWDKFDPMMQGLYDYLEFDDYQPELVKQFWDRYIELHK